MLNQYTAWPLIFLLSLAVAYFWLTAKKASIVPLVVLGIIWNTGVVWGVVWEGGKLLPLLILCSWVLRPQQAQIRSFNLVPRSFVLLIWYVLLMTLVGACLPIDRELNSLQPSIFQRVPLRGYISAIHWSFLPVSFLIGFRSPIDKKHLLTLVRVILISSLVAAIVAILQIGAHYTFSALEPVLSVFSHGSVNTTDIESSSASWYRPTPFCAEPRHFAFLMGFAAVTAILLGKLRIKELPRFAKSPYLIPLFIVLCFTGGSSSVTPGFAFSLAIVLTWLKFNGLQTGKGRSADLLIYILIVITVCLLIAVESKTHVIGKRTNYYVRIAGLADEQGPQGPVRGQSHSMAATLYWEWLRDSPLSLAFGVGPGNGGFHAFKYSGTSLEGDISHGVILSSRFAILDMIAATGLLGTFLQFFFWWQCWQRSARQVRSSGSSSIESRLFVRGMFLFLIAMLPIYNTTSLVWLFAGILLRTSIPDNKTILLVPTLHGVSRSQGSLQQSGQETLGVRQSNLCIADAAE